MKAAADSTLAEVRRKLQEGSKSLDKVNALIKLRSLRKDSAQRKGSCVFITSSPVFFRTLKLSHEMRYLSGLLWSQCHL